MRHALIRLLCLTLPLPPAAALADCVEPLRGEGEVRGEMARTELTRAERALVEERFAPDFAEAARLGLTTDGLFGFSRCELNGAAPEELVVVGRTTSHCAQATPLGNRGMDAICGVWALAETPEGWVQVLETAGRPRLSASRTNGWRDFVMERAGQQPAVFKYGGVAYQEDLGDADPRAEALDDYGGYGAGPDELVWYSFDDPMPEAVEAAFLEFYADEMRGPEGRVEVLPDAFRIGVADLDRDGSEDAVIQGASPEFCGPEGCLNWVLTGLTRHGGATMSGKLTGFDLQVAATGGQGGRDLIASGERGLMVWRNDGTGWALPEGY